MKKHTFALFLLFAAATGVNARISLAQASQKFLGWFKGPVSVSAGGTLSLFNSDEQDNELFGFGGYADLDFKRRLGFEAEARWLPLNGISGETQSNYLIGPRIQVRRVWKARPYVKFLGGVSRSTFNHGAGAGDFGTVAVGGGVDIPWKHNLTIRAIDYEYQFWPLYLGDPLTPHGFGSGVSYRFR